MNLTRDQRETRDSRVAGHDVHVELCNTRWTVKVDGKSLSGNSPSAYAAWAVGVAESFRLRRPLAINLGFPGFAVSRQHSRVGSPVAQPAQLCRRRLKSDGI